MRKLSVEHVIGMIKKFTMNINDRRIHILDKQKVYSANKIRKIF